MGLKKVFACEGENDVKRGETINSKFVETKYPRRDALNKEDEGGPKKSELEETTDARTENEVRRWTYSPAPGQTQYPWRKIRDLILRQ